MTKLEDITVGSSVKGIISNSTVTIVAVQWYGNNVLEITYKDSHGQPGNQMLLRDEEINLTVMDNSLPWSFDADGEQMKLASEAYRISLAHLFDPYLAVHTSSVEPLPHQISAVYQEMLPKLPLRYVLADDPGAGKTTRRSAVWMPPAGSAWTSIHSAPTTTSSMARQRSSQTPRAPPSR